MVKPVRHSSDFSAVFALLTSEASPLRAFVREAGALELPHLQTLEPKPAKAVWTSTALHPDARHLTLFARANDLFLGR